MGADEDGEANMAHTWLPSSARWWPCYFGGGGPRDQMVASATCHGDERASAQKREGKVLDLICTIVVIGREGVASGKE